MLFKDGGTVFELHLAVEQQDVIRFVKSLGVKGLKPATLTKSRVSPSKGVLWPHDNARRHSASATVEDIGQLKFELLPQLQYSPELSPLDCHMFGPLRGTLHGRRFAIDDGVKEAEENISCPSWDSNRGFSSP